MAPVHFLSDTSSLVAADAVAAVIVVDGASYLMQLRDDMPTIFYPGHWGCFGGAMDPGETPSEAIRREIEEELGFVPQACVELIHLDIALTRITGKTIRRRYFEIAVGAAEVSRFVLSEGAAVRAFAPAEILQAQFVIPYDAFALWLHHAQHRLR